ncbi:UBL domain-containing protein [Naegleria gruberi]|uniref:UBL domain-containing protein n=1 Tax=Naegleria gruberi TaxID=5762 RepID=D2VHE1_NAEGR|nr:UBL domain-containing protein [Naegleria gruberi]EFC43872.1 UBL domain-containing protein [Naegleria gruberi]|eukprot:XP_002676616.1 UBL domain-containing protein [Naegleria gruberi strain NEG-M]
MISNNNNSIVNVSFNILSKKTKCTLDLDENTSIQTIKKELEQDFGIPPSRTKIICSGKVLTNDITLRSLKRRKLQFMVMGEKPSSEFVSMTVEDCISTSLAFLTLEEIQTCRLVSKSWNQMCLKGSIKNRDRYTFLKDGKSCFDILQSKVIYTLPNTIASLKEMTSIHSPYIHERFEIFNKSGSEQKRVYTGTDYVFIFDPNRGKDTFQVVDVPTGQTVLSLSEDAFNQIKPLEVKLQQDKAFSTFKRELLTLKDKERRERLRQTFNDTMKNQQVAINSAEWQQRMIELQNEANDTRKFEESYEFQSVVERERKEFFKDNLLFVFYDHLTRKIVLEFPNYIALLDMKGVCRHFVTLRVKLPKEELEEATSSLLPIDKFYIVKTKKHNVHILDRMTLREVGLLKDVANVDRLISSIVTDDNQIYLLTGSESHFSLLSMTGTTVGDSFSGNLHVTPNNLFASGSVFDIDQLKNIFSGFDKDRNNLASGEPLVIFEDEEKSLGGFVYLSPYQANEKKATFGNLPYKKGCSCLKSVAVNVEHERHFRNREKVVEQVLTPSIVWSVPLEIPAKTSCKSYYLYGSNIYFACVHKPLKERQQQQEEVVDIEDESEETMEEPANEDEMADDVETEDLFGDTYLSVYCVDIKSGTLVWTFRKQLSERPNAVNIYPRSNSMFVETGEQEKTLYVISLLNGVLTFKTTLSDKSNDEVLKLILS